MDRTNAQGLYVYNNELVFYHIAFTTIGPDLYAMNVINANNELIEPGFILDTYVITDAYHIDGQTYIVTRTGMYQHIETTHTFAR